MMKKRFFIIISTGILLFSCQTKENRPTFRALQKSITIDADTSDWQGIKPEVVYQKSHLWLGQGMIQENWLGPQDLSFRWRAAWKDNKLYFLYDVTDDHISQFARSNTWLNDCVELCIDPKNKGGLRKSIILGSVKLDGYEIHFLPSNPPHAFLYDDESLYFTARPQDIIFKSQWKGQMVIKYTETGYIMELGFSVPEVNLTKGLTIGFETAICDDDGNGRKSLITWTGIQTDYWISMDNYGSLILQ